MKPYTERRRAALKKKGMVPLEDISCRCSDPMKHGHEEGCPNIKICPSRNSPTGEHYYDRFAGGIPVDSVLVPVTCRFCGCRDSGL